MRRLALIGSIVIIAATFAHSSHGQALPDSALKPVLEQQTATRTDHGAQPPRKNIAADTFTIVAGTHVLMALVSPLHSTSGTEGSDIYLEVIAPVVQDGRVVIPSHTYVQGAVQGNKRPGHFRRTSEFHFSFTTMIFPNNHVEPLDAVLQSIPGSKITRTNRDGSLHTVDQAEKVVVPFAAGAAIGAVIGSETRFGIGKFTGAGLGAGMGLASVLLHRGDAIDLPAGTRVEMVLRNGIKLSREQAEFNAKYLLPPLMIPAEPADTRQQPRYKHREPVLPWSLMGGLIVR